MKAPNMVGHRFGEEKSPSELVRRVEWELWAELAAKRAGDTATATGHALARAAYAWEFNLKFGRGTK
jgi:hypothetical protein